MPRGCGRAAWLAGVATLASQYPRHLEYLLGVTFRPAPRDLRASDSDRDRVISLLNDAVADGRLTVSEHSERVDRANAARTLGELAGLTTDLVEPTAQPIRLDHRGPVTAVFGSEHRDGRWVVPANSPVVAVFGDVTLDMRDALLQSSRTVIYATVVFSTLHLKVPDGVTVEISGTSVLTRKINRTVRQPGSQGPVIEVRALAIGGTIRVSTPPKKPRWLGGIKRNAV